MARSWVHCSYFAEVAYTQARAMSEVCHHLLSGLTVWKVLSARRKCFFTDKQGIQEQDRLACLQVIDGYSDKLTCSLTFPNAASYFPAIHWIIISIRGSARRSVEAIDCDQTRSNTNAKHIAQHSHSGFSRTVHKGFKEIYQCAGR